MNKYYLSDPREEASLQQRKENMREQERRDTALDDALGFTFPASDPVALNFSAPRTGTADPERPFAPA